MKRWILLSGFIICFICPSAYPTTPQNHFIIGEKEGEGQLVSPRQIREGPDGNIYAYDTANACIKVYSPEGRYLRKIGGRGQGPGEIQRADGVDYGFTIDGKLYFTEFFGGHPWITIMDVSGALHKTFHLKINEFFGIRTSCSLEDGGFLIELWLNSQPEARNDYFLYRYPQALVRVDPEGKIISEIVRADYFKTISYHQNGADQWLPFIPSFAWALLKDHSIVYSDGLSRALKTYDMSGRLIGEIKTSLPEPGKVRGVDLDEWRKSVEANMPDKAWFNKFGRVIERYKTSVHEKKPIFGGYSLTPDGNFLVSGSWTRGKKVSYWLMSSKGRTLLEMDLEGTGLSISKHFVFLNVLDADENDLIVCWKRSGEERGDLLRAKELPNLK